MLVKWIVGFFFKKLSLYRYAQVNFPCIFRYCHTRVRGLCCLLRSVLSLIVFQWFFTICSILFLSVFEVVYVFFSGCIWLCFGCISVGFSLICVVWNWFLFCCFVSQSASFPFLVLLLFFIQRHSLFAVCLSFGFPYPHTLTHFYLQLMLSCSLLFCYMRLFLGDLCSF